MYLWHNYYQLSSTWFVPIQGHCHSHIMSFRPDLLSVLAQQLQSADVLASHRVFMVLFRTLKELSTKRLAVDQKNYAEVISIYIIHLSMSITTQTCLCFIC